MPGHGLPPCPQPSKRIGQQQQACVFSIVLFKLDYLGSFVISIDPTQYFDSYFVKECEQAVTGKEISSMISRSLFQGHLNPYIILNNLQRPVTVANLRVDDFRNAERIPGDRVVKVS